MIVPMLARPVLVLPVLVPAACEALSCARLEKEMKNERWNTADLG